MNYNYKIPTNRYFSIERTFNCGQCFRFNQLDDLSFEGIAKGKYIKIYQDDKNIYFNCDEEEYKNIWYNYFDMERDYETIAKNLSEIDDVLKKAVEYSPGIRILKQDPFETLISFIISQNNNIPRIKGIVKKLCEMYGDEIPNKKGFFDFPSKENLANLKIEDLKELKCGFRDKYIIDAINKVNTKEVDFDKIKTMPIDKAREELMKIKGVGPKVADCVLLYGLNRLEIIPMDVWMKRTMSTFFAGKEYSIFGEYAGIAGQYLFHYSRVGKAIKE